MTGDKTTYTHDAVLKSCLEYYDGDLMQSSITQKKYLLRDRDDIFYEASPDHIHDRLAHEFARIEKKMNPIIDENAYFIRVRALLNRFSKTVPQGSPMAAIGNNFQIQSLSNCMVIASPHDSMAGIFKSGLEIAELQKRRAGVGLDLSTLRPMGSKVNNAALSSSGVACFSDFYSEITRMIGQRGRVGALMLTLDVKHPDAELFTTMKSDLIKVTGANVSLRLSDEFMRAVENDKEFVQQWPVDVPIVQAKVVKKIKAKDLWNIIIEQAWKTAEPGLLMWDNYISMLPANEYPDYKAVSTNPCAELILSAYDSCRLISQNLLGWVKNRFTKDAYFDFDEYYEDTKVAQRMSDGLVELELEAVQKIIDVSEETEKLLWQKIYNAAYNGRRTGLGTHGLADVFLALGIKYDSDEAIELTNKIYKKHKLASYTESVQLAKERGPFPAWDWKYDKNSEFIQKLPDELKSDIKKYGRRNISNLTIAPTGSVSVVSSASSGIEPVFRWVYDRRIKITQSDASIPVDYIDAIGDKWTNYRVIHPVVKQYLNAKNIKCPIDGGRDFSVSLEDANEAIIKLLPKWFVTSDKIDYMQSLKLQAVATSHLDHGCSKTINLPRGTKIDEISEVYFKAWKLGIKGVTVYVDGSRDGVLISETKKEPSDDNRPLSIIDNHAPKRPKSLPAEIHRIKIKGKDWAVVVGLLDGKPYETFAGRGLVLPKTDLIESATITKVSNGRYKLSIKIVNNGIEEYNDLREIYDNNEERVITRSVCRELRHGIPIEFIAKDLAEHSGSIANFSAALARVLKKYAKNANRLMKKCPQCSGTDFIMQDGCASCVTCYFSKCS